MGFFDLFKRNKSKVFELPPQSDNMFVQAVSYSLSKVTLGDTLKVKKDWMVVLVAKDKALDIFSEGEHKLNLGVMPLLTKTLKLDIGKKKKRRGNIVIELPKDFLCDIYFVNTKLFENRIWKTESIKYKDKKEVIKFWVQGRYDVQVANARDVIELFLIDWGFIRSDMALGKIDFLVSEFLTEEISKLKGLTIKEISKQDMFDKLLKPKIDKKFEKYGLKFSNVGIEAVIYPKNVEISTASNDVTDEKLDDIEKEQQDSVLQLGEDVEENNVDTETEKQNKKADSKQNKEKKNGKQQKQSEKENKKAEKENTKEENQLNNSSKEDKKEQLVAVGAKRQKSKTESKQEEKNFVNVENLDEPCDNLQELHNSTEPQNEENTKQKTSIFDNEVEAPKLGGRKRQSIKVCKYCGEIVKAKSTKCEHCGRDQEEESLAKVVCPECGQENEDGTLFCKCGCYLPPKDL